MCFHTSHNYVHPHQRENNVDGSDKSPTSGLLWAPKVGWGNPFCRCRMIEAGVCQPESARTTSSTFSKSSCPSNPSISPFPPRAARPTLLPRWMPQAGSRASPGPQCGGLIGDHTPGGPCEGGRPGGRPGLSRAPARTPPISEEPLRGAGGWGNRLLVVTDDDGVAVMGWTRTP